MRFAVLSALVAVPLIGQADSNFIPLRNHRSTSLNFMRPLPLGKILKQSQFESSWQLAISNELRNLPVSRIYEDAETWRFAYRARWALKNNDEFFVEAPLLYRGPGVLDPVLAWWHRIFVDDSVPLRDNTSFGQSEIQIPNGRYLSSFGPGDITVAYGKQTSVGAIRTWTKLPTGNPAQFFGSGNFDFGISLDQDFHINKKWSAGFHAGLTWQGKPKLIENARPLVESAAINIAYKANSIDTWFLQWNSEASPTKNNRSPADITHRVISLGYSKTTSKDKLTLYFQEDGDFGWFDFRGGAQIGPDWTMGVIYTIRK